MRLSSLATLGRRLPPLIALLVLLGACAAPQLSVEPIAITADPKAEIEALDKELTEARIAEIHTLAPLSFQAAGESLGRARALHRDGERVELVLRQVAEGRAYLSRGKERAGVASTVLMLVLKARQEAQRAGAVNLGADFVAAEERLLELTRAVEQERMSWVERRSPELARTYKDLELRAIKDSALGQARRLIAEARQLDAQKLLPQSYAATLAAVEESDAFIEQSRYAEEEIARRSRQALFDARRLLHLTEAARRLNAMTAEQSALWIEKLLYQPAARLMETDLRDQSLERQSESMSAAIGLLLAQLDESLNKIAALEGQTRQERAARDLHIWEQRATRERLEEERRFQQYVASAREMLSPEEAEVYKQGGSLVLRLRAMEFPVGQYIIMPENYPLLGKIHRLIKMIGEPAVTIEGHTDSTGNETNNVQLSQRRAQAVRDFFLANDTLPARRVIAVGYGSRRPLAPNTTQEGRAINRRIDILITPQIQPGN